jgi:hypothetical protein
MGNVLVVVIKFILGLFKSSPATPVAPTGVISCVATCFGYEDPGDNGKGAWGDDNGLKTSCGVSVPIPIVLQSLGSTSKEVVKEHRVVVKLGSKVADFEITDLGPGESVNHQKGLIWERKANIGHLLDLTYGACEKLGVKYDANRGSWRVTYWIVDKNGNPIVLKGLDAPKYYV